MLKEHTEQKARCAMNVLRIMPLAQANWHDGSTIKICCQIKMDLRKSDVGAFYAGAR
jgi:hypothetical protein